MSVEYITSRKNPLLQQVRKLLSSRGERQDTGLFVGDGTKLLEEAVKWYPGLHTVIVSDERIAADLPESVRLCIVPRDVMESISPMKTPQGALFLCRMPEKREPALTPGSLVLDGIQDPGNLGTILRTADALEVPVILTEGCADPYNWKTVRASMGAVFRTQPMQATGDWVIEACKKKDIPLAVTALADDAEDIRRARLAEYAVVIGSEGQGVGPTLTKHCSRKLIIPMNTRCESLNAGVAATIVMWQMRSNL